MSLHIGDRLLEVNGMPVKDQPLEKIESLLRSPDSTLQVIGINHNTFLLIILVAYFFI